MENLTLKPESYVISINSRIEGKLYSGKANFTPSRIIGPYKKGTLSSGDNVPPKGHITLNTKTKGVIEFNYLAKENFTGDDSFEFIVEYSNGDKGRQVVNILVREKFTEKRTNDKYIDIYLSSVSQNTLIKTITSAYRGSLEVPTVVTYSQMKKDLLSAEKSSVHDFTKNYGSIINAGTKTQVETRTTVTNFNNQSDGTKIRAITDIEITLNKSSEYLGNEYGLVKFKDFINRTTGKNSDLEENIYINWKLRPVTLEYEDSTTDIVVPEFDELPPPNFVYPDIQFPDVPTQIDVTPPTEKNGGQLLAGTKAHRELDGRGNYTVRVGKKVPEGAVNLAYYYNTTASMDDTVSVIETNMNNVTLHYVEDWIHKRNLNEKNDDLFPDCIEFEGEEGTELEGYYGTLYREYVMWEEQTIDDLDPQLKTVYQEYRGITKDSLDNVPIIWNYKDDERQGKLELINTVVEAISFQDNMPKRFVCYAKYEGLTTLITTRYHGSAKYGGVVTKKDGMANIDPEQPREIIMYPDDTGLLSRENGDELVDDDLFYITDKFKDGEPLYYKHRLKYRIYDSIGPDRYGVYKNNNIKLVLENNYDLDSNKYKWGLYVEPTKWDNIYDAYIYTSFIPSSETPVYAMYDGMPVESYDGDEKINPINSKVGILERLSVYPAMHHSEYTVDKKLSLTKQSTITMNNINVILDEREPIEVEFMIMADDMESTVFRTEVLNYKYAISTERDKFVNQEMIASTKSANGYLTAKDMFLRSATQEQIEAITDDTIFRIRFNTRDITTFNNKDKVIMYTDPSGGGLVMARTYVDTGLPGEIADDSDVPRMNRLVSDGHIYIVKDKKIYRGYSVLCRNVSQITINPPVESDPLKSWLPAVNYSYFHKAYERIDKSIQLVYSVPEFYSQIYSEYGRPYVEVKGEKSRNLGGGKVKVSRYPLYIEPSLAWEPKNIVGRKVMPDGIKRLLTVKNFDFKDGIIEFEDKISDNDLIEIDYMYEEKYYHYRGYYENSNASSKIVGLNLNPNMYNYYTDNENELYFDANVYNLFNRTVHFFLRPMRVIDRSTGEILEENEFAIYHRIDQPDATSPFDLHIGRIFIRHHTSLKSTKVIDTRSRGGGVLESIKDELRRELEPESDDYLDIGTLDGKPFHENSVVVIKVDERLLIQYGGRFSEHEIKAAVDKWSAYGMFPIIEYVKTLHDDELPQSTIEVENTIENITDSFKPYIEAIIKE